MGQEHIHDLIDASKDGPIIDIVVSESKYFDVFVGCVIHRRFNYYCHQCLVDSFGQLLQFLTDKDKPDNPKFPTEQLEALAIVEAYLKGGPEPFEAWHHIDNASNDLLREIVKQLVHRCIAAKKELEEWNADHLPDVLS